MQLSSVLSFLLVINVIFGVFSVTPIVLWHGMGDTCCFPFSLGSIKKLLENELGKNDTYVVSIKIGGSIVSDFESGFFGNPNKQIKEVCKTLEADPRLANGYNAIGFSQGGLFLRALAQQCSTPQMKILVSVGGPQQGVFGLPSCPSLSHRACENIRILLNSVAYREWIQDYLVQATYWHDPLQETLYREKSTFLGIMNNEYNINRTYIENLQKLSKLILVKFLNDTVVQPLESEWFGFYKTGQDTVVVPMEETNTYLQDKLGLQQMAYNQKLVFLESPGDHLQFTRKWFIENIVTALRD